VSGCNVRRDTRFYSTCCASRYRQSDLELGETQGKPLTGLRRHVRYHDSAGPEWAWVGFLIVAVAVAVMPEISAALAPFGEALGAVVKPSVVLVIAAIAIIRIIAGILAAFAGVGLTC
jgi:hypothetical protein